MSLKYCVWTGMNDKEVKALVQNTCHHEYRTDMFIKLETNEVISVYWIQSIKKQINQLLGLFVKL